MPNESHTTHVDSRKRATTPATSTEPSPRPDLPPMKLEAATRGLRLLTTKIPDVQPDGGSTDIVMAAGPASEGQGLA
jgi:hypothetical protein